MENTKVVPSVKSLSSFIKDIDSMNVTPEKKVFYIQAILTYIDMISDLHTIRLRLKNNNIETKEIIEIIENYSITKEQIG